MLETDVMPPFTPHLEKTVYSEIPGVLKAQWSVEHKIHDQDN